MSNNKRQPGYYRVKYNGQWTVGKYITIDGFYEWAIPETEYYYYRVKYNGQWTVGKYITIDGFYEWAIPETEYYYCDRELDEIDETPINPEPTIERTKERKSAIEAASKLYVSNWQDKQEQAMIRAAFIDGFYEWAIPETEYYYYRVKYNGQWTVGKYITIDGFYEWAIPETEYYYCDRELDEIDETPINPEPTIERTKERKSAIEAASKLYVSNWQDKQEQAMIRAAFRRGAKWADENPIKIEINSHNEQR